MYFGYVKEKIFYLNNFSKETIKIETFTYIEKL